MNVGVKDGMLVVDLGSEHVCLSSAVLGGGLGVVRNWCNLQVQPDYARTDPASHLRAATAHIASPAVGMMTAADVNSFVQRTEDLALVWATLGLGHAVAAAGTRPRLLASVGTINLLVVSRRALTPTGLASALQTAVEAKVQALAEAGVRATNSPGWATGTPTDSICVASPPGQGSDFAGSATPVGVSVARAVHGAILEGAIRLRRAAARSAVGGSP